MKKIIAWILCAVMLLSMAACGTEPAETNPPQTSTPATNPPETKPVETQPPVVEPVEASVNFEDGNLGFVALYEGMANADASTYEIVDFNGSKALKVTNGSGKVPYIAIDVWSLLGENAANVATIEMSMGIENPDGEFYACAGEMMLWNTKELSKTKLGWSVYLEKKNPKTAVFKMDPANGVVFSADVAPIAVITLSTDNGATAGVANANFFIDDIRFLDADGNLIAADTTVAFAAPDGFSGAKDMSNLAYLSASTVALEGMAGISGGAWSQNGVDITPEFLAALVPGAVVEIEYSSTTGDIWVVMPDSAAGWMRINPDNGVTVTYNNSKNIAQLTYEQFVSVLGEDTSTWGARLQCESSGDWEVYSVKVGTNSGLKHSATATVVHEGSVTGGAWGQSDIIADSAALLEQLVPGTYLEVAYTTDSATGNLWLVFPDSAAGWMRINPDNGVPFCCNGSIMQISYEQIAAVLGEDKSNWGARIQGESDGNWEVFSMKLVTACFYNTSNNAVVYEGSVTGGAWGQSDIIADLTTIADKLVPGSVITVKYTTDSATGNLWLVFPDSAAGWMRINGDNGVSVACDGSTMQVTYEQIAAVLGEDVTTWGARIQGESDGNWEVFSLSIGTAG